MGRGVKIERLRHEYHNASGPKGSMCNQRELTPETCRGEEGQRKHMLPSPLRPCDGLDGNTERGKDRTSWRR